MYMYTTGDDVLYMYTRIVSDSPLQPLFVCRGETPNYDKSTLDYPKTSAKAFKSLEEEGGDYYGTSFLYSTR